MEKNLYNALNEQVSAEFFASNLYLSMSAYFESNDLPGFANWMRIQFKEEQDHALKIFDFLLSRDEKVKIKALEQPESKWDKPINAIESALKHEKKVTGMIYEIMGLAQDAKDYPTINLINWFVDEQVEEEANAKYLLSQLKMATSPEAMIILDRELATRTYTAPADAK